MIGMMIRNAGRRCLQQHQRCALSSTVSSNSKLGGIKFSSPRRRKLETAPPIAQAAEVVITEGHRVVEPQGVVDVVKLKTIEYRRKKNGDDDDVIVLDGTELADNGGPNAKAIREDFDDEDDDERLMPMNNIARRTLKRPPKSMVKQRKPMDAPPELVEGLKRILTPYSLRRLASDYEKLAKETLEFEKGSSIKVPAYDSRRSVAYLAFRTVPAFGVIKAALQRVIEAGYKLPEHEDGSVLALDFGAGPGTASWAARDAFQLANVKGTDSDKSKRAKRYEVTFVESSLPMIDAAVQLAENHFEANWCRNILELAKSVSKEGAARFDLVLASFSLSDLPSDEARQVAVDLLWESVAPNGLLLIVERGTPRGSFIVGKARKQVLAGGSRFDLERLRKRKSKVMDEQALTESRNGDDEVTDYVPKVVAPCGHEKPCPLLRIAESYGGDLQFDRMKKHEFCHFVQCTSRLLKATTDDNSVPLRMNYSYVAIQKRPIAEEHSEEMNSFRVLRKPSKNVRHVVVDLCDPFAVSEDADGGIRKQTIAHSDKETYRLARKLEWGDLFVEDAAFKARLALKAQRRQVILEDDFEYEEGMEDDDKEAETETSTRPRKTRTDRRS